MGWERARKPEQKEQRRAEILRATRDLLRERALADVSLSAIARASQVSKANIYRYFESREAILLELLLGHAEAMVADFERALASLSGGGDVPAVADAITRTLVEHPAFVELFAVVSSVLEKNVSADAIRSFKRRIGFQILRPVNALHAAIPALSIDDARRALTHVLIHVCGLWPSAHPVGDVAAVLDEPEFQMLRLDYEDVLRDNVCIILRGILARPSAS